MILTLYGSLRGHGLSLGKDLMEGTLPRFSTDSIHHALVVGALSLRTLKGQEEWKGWATDATE